MRHEQLNIMTSDGACPTHLFAPDEGAHPAVLFFMDAGGIRPAVIAMAERLAAGGFVVLLPDLFYRYGPYGPIDPGEVFQGDVRAILGPLMATTSNAKAAEDVDAFLASLDGHADVVGNVIGVVGFCMGGGMAVAAAGSRPDRIGAVATFHAGNLATDALDSPHRYAAELNAELYVAAAEHDGSYPPTMAERFEDALRAADVPFTAATYPAAHGWMKPDFPVYDEDVAEQGWRDMLAFFRRTLRPAG